MKNYLTILFAMTIILSFNFVSIENNKALGAMFSWEKMIHDFGEIKINEPVTNEFSFQNTGDQPLIIISTKASCGCTVAKYTKGEILPGEYGSVTATYNAAKTGAFSKTVTVNANAGSTDIKLQIHGEVMP
jgi:hypothetical protein